MTLQKMRRLKGIVWNCNPKLIPKDSMTLQKMRRLKGLQVRCFNVDIDGRFNDSSEDEKTESIFMSVIGYYFCIRFNDSSEDEKTERFSVKGCLRLCCL